jgi:pimeloyl-ACP methyl ester carboxylesterase
MMEPLLMQKIEDKFVTAGGLQLRYLAMGQGRPVIFLHGASLGSSADVFLRNMPAFAQAGLRAIAFDQPGFGLSDASGDHSAGLRRKSVISIMDALEIESAALVAHSQAGNFAIQLALESPQRVSHVGILGTGSLLPPLAVEKEGLEGAVQQRLERRMAAHEPSIEDTRKLLEANLFHHELITQSELDLRHARSVGRNFETFVARSSQPAAPKKADAIPMWKRLDEVSQPLLMIYGRNDRANAFERATMLKESSPHLNLHIAPDCKHLVPWDAQDLVADLLVPFIK